MTRFNTINLSNLPAPNVIETLGYETTLAEMVAIFKARWAVIRGINPTLPNYDVEVLETDPVMIVIEAFVAREIALRARINDAAKAVMVASAIGSDLDHLAALFKIGRQEDETDRRFRVRLQAGIEAYSSAGPRAAYVFHALDAVPALRDASAISTAPGHVLVTCLAEDPDVPIPTVDELNLVRDRLSQDRTRPLTDFITVAEPGIVETEIVAQLTLYPGPSAASVIAAATAAVANLVEKTRYLGFDLKRSAVISRLHQEGVHSVALVSPAADINLDATQACKVTDVTITVVATDE